MHVSDHQGGDASTINTREGCLVKDDELHAWRMEEEQDLFLALMVLLHRNMNMDVIILN